MRETFVVCVCPLFSLVVNLNELHKRRLESGGGQSVASTACLHHLQTK